MFTGRGEAFDAIHTTYARDVSVWIVALFARNTLPRECASFKRIKFEELKASVGTINKKKAF